MNLKIAICDDDNNQVQLTKTLIDSVELNIDYDVIVSNSGEELLNCEGLNKIDVVFLDIEMGGINGIQTASSIRDLNKEAIIVFITGFKDYVLDAYELNAYHYLIKPISKEKISNLMKGIIKRKEEIEAYQEKIARFTIKTKEQIIEIRYNEIYYFEKNLKSIVLHTREEKIKFRGTFIKLMDAVDSRYFQQCHQGFIVNKTKIIKYKDGFLSIRDIDIDIPVSRRYKDKVIRILENNLF